MIISTPNFSDRIKRLRIKLGLTQEAFGMKLGMTATTARTNVCRWENGIRFPSLRVAMKIQRVFKLDLSTYFI